MTNTLSPQQKRIQFGAWVQATREARDMDVRAFAQVVKVDASTISRVERERTQVTFWTAVRIGEGVGATPVEVLTALFGERPRWVHEIQEQRVSEVLTITDLKAVLELLARDWSAGCRWLAGLLNRIASVSDQRASVTSALTAQLMVPEDIEKLLQDSRLYQFKIQYPEAITAEEIWQIYARGGALSLVDIGTYLRHVRRTRRVTLAGLEEAVSLSASVISRLETGALERVKLADVLALDQQLAQEGKVVAMYWRACLLLDAIISQPEPPARAKHTTFLDQREDQMKVVELFLAICRWFATQSGPGTSWLHEIRRHFQQGEA